MQIVECDGLMASCSNLGETRLIDLSLVGEQPAGAWVLTFLDTAREVLDENRAMQINDALTALNLAMNGQDEGIDSLFADLIDREPELPAHLR